MAKVKRIVEGQPGAFEAFATTPVSAEQRYDALTPAITSGLGNPASDIKLDDYRGVKNKFLTGNPTNDMLSLDETRALNQSTAGLIAKGLGNVTSTFVSEILKIPGYVGGLLTDTVSGNVFSGNFSNTVDNFWINGVNWVKENTADEAFKVYTPPSLGNEGLLGQIMNPYFWAKEGADGVGFLLSFLVPGQALKLLGLGGKTAKLIGKFGRALDYEQIAAKIDSGLAVGVNTILESAAEGSNAYDNLISQGYSPEEAGKLASNVVKWNLPTLLVSNLILEKYIMSGFGRLQGKSGFGRLTTEAIEGSKTLRKQYNPFKPNVVTGLIQEGLFEEGLQTSIEQVNGKSLYDITSKYWDNITTMFNDDADSDAIDFGKSVILGGVLGSGMSVLQNVQENKASNRLLFGSQAYTPRNTFEKFIRGKARESKEGLLSVFKTNYAAIKQDAKELFEYNDKGEIVRFKPDALNNLKNNIGTNLLVNFYNDLIRKYDGNVEEAKRALITQMGKQGADIHEMFQVNADLSSQEVLEQLQNREDLNYFLNFLVQQDGKTLLREHIPAVAKQVKERYEANTGQTAASVEEFERELKEKAERYIKIYDKVNKEHSPYRLQANPFKSGQEPDRGNTFERFFTAAKNSKLALLADIDLATNRITSIDRDIEELPKDENGRYSPIDYKTVKRLQKDREVYAQMKANAETEYLELDDTKSLQDKWEKAYTGYTESVKAAQEEKETEQAQQALVDNYEEEIAKFGYEVNDNVHFMNNGVRFTVTKQKDGTYLIRNEKDISKAKVSATPNIGEKSNIIPKEDVRKERERRRIREAAIKEKLKQEAIVKAVQEKLIDVRRRQDTTKQALETLTSELDELVSNINEYNKRIAERKGVTEARKLLKQAEKLRKTLTTSRDSLAQELEMYQEQELLLLQLVENPEYINEAKSLFPKVEETLADLRSLIPNIETQISKLNRKISTLEIVADKLRDFLNVHDIVDELDRREFSKQFQDKYSYTTDAGDIKSLPAEYKRIESGLARNHITRRVEAFLNALAEAKGIPVEQLKEELLEDIRKLNMDTSRLLVTSNKLDELNATRKKLEEVENQLKQVEAEFKELAIKKDIQVYETIKADLNSRFKSIKITKKQPERLKETGVSSKDTPDSQYDGNNVWWNKLSNFFISTTGLNVEYGDNRKDLFTVTNGIRHPIVSWSVYQKTWFEFLDTDPDLTDKKLLLVVGKYDNSDELQKAFATNNPTDQDPGNDVYAVFTDSKGNPIRHNGVLVFSSLRRVNSMFPEGTSTVNMNKLTRLFADANGIRSFKQPNAAEKERLQEIFGTSTINKPMLDAKVLEWAKSEYTAFLDKVKAKGRVYANIGEISSGHPLRLYDAETGDLLTASPIKALDLKFNANGTPANFEVLQATKDGSLIINGIVKKGFMPGTVYVKKGNQVLPLISDHLNNQEIDLIVDVIKLFAGRETLKGFVSPNDIQATGFPEDKWMFVRGQKIQYSTNLDSKRLPIFPTKDSRFSLMTMLFNWGEFGNSEYDIYIYQKNLVLGTVKIPLNKIDEHIDEVKAFLAKKRFHINFSLLNSANAKYTPYFHPVKMQSGKLVFEEKRFLPYVLSRMKLDMLPKAKYTELGLPQFAQKNVEILGLAGEASPPPAAPPNIETTPVEFVDEGIDLTGNYEMPKEIDDFFTGIDAVVEDNPLLAFAGVEAIDVLSLGEDINSAKDIEKEETPVIAEEEGTNFEAASFFEASDDSDAIIAYKKLNSFEKLDELINKGVIDKKC